MADKGENRFQRLVPLVEDRALTLYSVAFDFVGGSPERK
jgi:hypothetical protein